MTTMYGLPRCDTCKKARAWLDERGVEYTFVDYREQPIAARELLACGRELGWDKLVNRASTTWRGLSDAEKAAQSDEQWLLLLAVHPTLIRRPLLVREGTPVAAGFKPAVYDVLFPAS